MAVTMRSKGSSKGKGKHQQKQQMPKPWGNVIQKIGKQATKPAPPQKARSAPQGGTWAFIPAGVKVPKVQGMRVVQNMPRFQQQKFQQPVKQQGKGSKGSGKGFRPTKVVQAPVSKEVEAGRERMQKLAGIDKEKKVWIGNLPEKATWKDLVNLFKTEEVKPALTHIMKKGTACVAFKSADDAEKAISTFNGAEVKGNAIEVDVWTQKEKTEGQGRRNKKANKIKSKISSATTNAVNKSKFVKKVMASKKGKVKKELTPGQEKIRDKLKAIDNDQKVWVGGLSDKTTFKTLRKHFVEQGCKPEVVSVYDGKACVAFETAGDADSAISTLNGSTVDGKAIEVDVWTKPERPNKKERKHKKGKKSEDA